MYEMNYSNEHKLLEHLKNGEEKAFVYLVDTYNQRLFGYALTLSHNEEMAQDIIQNVFLKTWAKRKKITINTSLQNYLFRLVHNEFINLYNQNRSRVLLEHKYFESLERITDNYDEKLLKRAIKKITLEIQNLPPKCKEVFILSRKEGLTNIEISEYLNVSIKTVEAHITKAYSIMRKNLKDNFDAILFMLFGLPVQCDNEY